MRKKREEGVGWWYVLGTRRITCGQVKLQIACGECALVQEVFLWSWAGTGRVCEEESCGKLIDYNKKLGEIGEGA